MALVGKLPKVYFLTHCFYWLFFVEFHRQSPFVQEPGLFTLNQTTKLT